MLADERPAWFLGDLDDPWVSAIAEVLPGWVRRVPCPGEWPETLFSEGPVPATLLLHRATLTAPDAERLARLRRDPAKSPRVVLCIGPNVRYADLQRWSTLVDVVCPEATARETIARHVVGEGEGIARPPGPRPQVSIVSGNFELRQALADVCRSTGYPAEPFASWSDVPPAGLAVWDVPVLEPDWPGLLARRSRHRALVALLGFADRALVAQARAQGASACLELPCERADLAFVLDRLSSTRAEPGHEVPPPPAGRRKGPRSVAGPGCDAYN